MRLPFFNPRKDEVAAIATDLITRFGLRAHEEAAHLVELSLQMGSRRKGALYELVAREIEAKLSRSAETTGSSPKRIGYRAPWRACFRGKRWRS
jgi:hypothetical protein